MSRPSSESRPTEPAAPLTAAGARRAECVVVFPNKRTLGLANLGVHAIARIAACRNEIGCDLGFADLTGSLLAKRALGSFGILAFSLPFEADYPAMLSILDQAGVSRRTVDRDERGPLVVGGGMGPSLNPEPIAPFLDVILLGEGESSLPRFFDFHLDHRDLKRADYLAELADARLEGVYVPSRYDVAERKNYSIERAPLGLADPSPARLWEEPDWEPATSQLLTDDDAFGGAYLMEISRGCPHGCRFCAAGYGTRPARFLSADLLVDLAARGAKAAGKVGLVGAAVSDHPEFTRIGEAVLATGAELTVSSFRVENMNEANLELLIRGGLKTLTIAVEAGSKRLRNLIGKTVSAEELLEGASLAGRLGLRSLKIYAMTGLPAETDEDALALVELAAEARKRLGQGLVSLSVAPFVPKPSTPLQFDAFADEKSLRTRLRLIKSRVGRDKGLRFSAEPVRAARLQAVLSRGGRSVADLIERLADGEAISRILSSPQAIGLLAHRPAPDETLPWDFIGGQVSKAHLERERERGLAGKPPAPCVRGKCRICEVCG